MSHSAKAASKAAVSSLISLKCTDCKQNTLADTIIVEVDGLVFHAQCLRCSDCDVLLCNESDVCFCKRGLFFCRQHYFQQHGVLCKRCSRPIYPEDWMRKAGSNTDCCYHIACFICTSCKRQLSTGEQYGLVNGWVYCITHYSEINNTNTTDTASESPKDQRSSSKRIRTSFNDRQLKALQASYSLECNPDASEIERLSATTSLSKRVIQVWFQNARARQKKSVSVLANDTFSYYV